MKLPVTILIFLFLLNACKKDETSQLILTLPEKTDSGQNSFGFLLNSEVWTNYGQACLNGGCRGNLAAIYDTTTGYFFMRADKVLYNNGLWNTQESIEFNIDSIARTPKTYSFSTHDTISVSYSIFEITKLRKTYLLSDSFPDFTLKIVTLDTAKKILSGEFSGKLFRQINDTTVETSRSDSIVIKDGRFDFKLN